MWFLFVKENHSSATQRLEKKRFQRERLKIVKSIHSYSNDSENKNNHGSNFSTKKKIYIYIFSSHFL